MEYNIKQEDIDFWNKVDANIDQKIIRKELSRIKKETQKELADDLLSFYTSDAVTDCKTVEEVIDSLDGLYKEWKDV